MGRLCSVFLLLFLLLSAAAFGQQTTGLVCDTVAVPAQIRLEGLAERVGDIVLNCSGGIPNQAFNANFTIFLSLPLTNHLSGNNVDVLLTVDNGSGPQPAGTSVYYAVGNNRGVAINNVPVQLSPTGAASFRITNIRVAVAGQNAVEGTPVIANLSVNTGQVIALNRNPVVVALALPGLFANLIPTIIPCNPGSPLPDVINFANLLARGTRFFTQRVTEGFAAAFRPRAEYEDQGTRFVLRYGNIYPGARLFVPDVVVGSGNPVLTSAGDFGLPRSGGVFRPGQNGSLLLVRVLGADANGAGGSLAYFPPDNVTTPISFNDVNEVSVTNGSAYAVYEVVASDNRLYETATIPTFVGITPQREVDATVNASLNVTFGPLSTIAVPSATAPVPRFANIVPGNDCTILQDCTASYRPKLQVEAPNLTTFQYPGNALSYLVYVRVRNEGGGLLFWNTAITYQSGNNWLQIDTPAGINQATFGLRVLPNTLSPGVYEATVRIDGGGAANQITLPVRLTVTAPPPPSTVVTAIVNGASFSTGPIAPGSIATIFGANLKGNPMVLFDSLSARVFFANDSQINLLVPEQLASQPTSKLIVRGSDGSTSTAITVNLTPVAPGIFANGVLNQDSSPNTPARPASRGDVVQIYATGLQPVALGPVWVEIGNTRYDQLEYAGDAPGFAGLQQINLRLPATVPSGTSDIRVCGGIPATTGTQVNPRVCSPSYRVSVQ